MSVVEQMLQKYALATHEDKTWALREVMQEIALAGLYRGGFFAKAAFYGGPACAFFMGCHDFLKTLIFLCSSQMQRSRLSRTSGC